MRKAYIKNFGVYHKYAKDSSALFDLVATRPLAINAPVEHYTIPKIDIVDLKIVKREDRAVLNTISKISINALVDLRHKTRLCPSIK